jgi:hypothetical protein
MLFRMNRAFFFATAIALLYAMRVSCISHDSLVSFVSVDRTHDKGHLLLAESTAAKLTALDNSNDINTSFANYNMTQPIQHKPRTLLHHGTKDWFRNRKAVLSSDMQLPVTTTNAHRLILKYKEVLEKIRKDRDSFSGDGEGYLYQSKEFEHKIRGCISGWKRRIRKSGSQQDLEYIGLTVEDRIHGTGLFRRLRKLFRYLRCDRHKHARRANVYPI